MRRVALTGALLALLLLTGVAAHRLWTFGLAPSGTQSVPAEGTLAVLPSPDAPVSILLLGTSLTAGGDWPERLRQALSDCRPGSVLVDRLARPGGSSKWGAPALRQRLAAGPPPDLIIAEFTINDASLWHGVPLRESVALLSEILSDAEAAGSAVFLASMNPAAGTEWLERPGHRAYRQAWAGAAAAAGDVGWIDTVPNWRALDADRWRALVPDDLHPTDAAMAEIHVPALFGRLAPALCAQAR